MADITAKMVKDLRDKTDAGMMDCKKALVEADGDMEKAVDILRKSGMAKAAKKSGRGVKEGKVGSKVDGKVGAMVEVLCETDFVATNDKFKGYVDSLVAKVADSATNGDASAEIAEKEKDGLTEMIATIGENMMIRRAVRWESAGKCASYLHMGGRIGVLVDVEGCDDDAVLTDLCMHIAAFKPTYVAPEDIPADIDAKEREIAAGQVAGKPAEIIDKIVNGKISKWHNEVCLMKQPWIRDDKQSVEKANPGMVVKRFLRWEVGEEI